LNISLGDAYPELWKTAAICERGNVCMERLRYYLPAGVKLPFTIEDIEISTNLLLQSGRFRIARKLAKGQVTSR